MSHYRDFLEAVRAGYRVVKEDHDYLAFSPKEIAALEAMPSCDLGGVFIEGHPDNPGDFDDRVERLERSRLKVNRKPLAISFLVQNNDKTLTIPLVITDVGNQLATLSKSNSVGRLIGYFGSNDDDEPWLRQTLSVQPGLHFHNQVCVAYQMANER